MVNTRAMHLLSKTVDGKIYDKRLPKLDDVLDQFVNEVMDKFNADGDDVDEADFEEEDDDDDEELEMENEDQFDELHEDMRVNANLDACFEF